MKNKSLWAYALLTTLLWHSAAFAQAMHVYLSASGDDSKACTSTSPCKTFTGALAKVAAGGTVTVLDSSEYQAFTILKAVNINVAAGNHPSIVGSVPTTTRSEVPAAIWIAVYSDPTAAVNIDGLNFYFSEGNKQTAGIALEEVGDLTISNVNIIGAYFYGINLTSAGNTITLTNVNMSRGKTGISIGLRSNSKGRIIARNIFISNYETGILTFYEAGFISVSHSTIENASKDGLFIGGTRGSPPQNMRIFISHTDFINTNRAIYQGPEHSVLYLSHDNFFGFTTLAESSAIYSDGTNLVVGDSGGSNWIELRPQ